MAWTDDEWQTFAALLEDGWPGEFDDRAADAYRVLLGDIDPPRAVTALRALLRTSKWRPSAAEIVQTAETDHRRPTFDEAFHVLFEHPHSPLKARTTGEAVNRAMSFHPLIARFVQVMGRDRLAYLEVFDPDYGRVRRQELRTTWQEIDETTRGRDVAAMVAGSGERRGQLGRFDPLRALGVADRRELEPGERRAA